MPTRSARPCSSRISPLATRHSFQCLLRLNVGCSAVTRLLALPKRRNSKWIRLALQQVGTAEHVESWFSGSQKADVYRLPQRPDMPLRLCRVNLPTKMSDIPIFFSDCGFLTQLARHSFEHGVATQVMWSEALDSGALGSTSDDMPDCFGRDFHRPIQLHSCSRDGKCFRL